MAQSKQSVNGQVHTLQQQKVALQPEQNYLAMLGHSAFPDTEAMIIIRLSNDDLTGAKFEALINATRLRYKSFKIIMADTIEGHLVGSREQGKDMAAEWLVKNAQYMTDKEINGIISWDKIAGGAVFKRKHDMLKLLYTGNDDARYYINMTCADRMRRLVGKTPANNNGADQKELMKNVLNYRLEELAGLAILRDKNDIPELSTEDFVSDDRLYDRLSKETLIMPRIYPVTFQVVSNNTPLSLED